MTQTPNEILAATTPEVRSVIDQILKIEKANKHIQNLASNKQLEAKIADDILKVIYQEIS
jgi:hypothetical protein